MSEDIIRMQKEIDDLKKFDKDNAKRLDKVEGRLAALEKKLESLMREKKQFGTVKTRQLGGKDDKVYDINEDPIIQEAYNKFNEMKEQAVESHIKEMNIHYHYEPSWDEEVKNIDKLLDFLFKCNEIQSKNGKRYRLVELNEAQAEEPEYITDDWGKIWKKAEYLKVRQQKGVKYIKTRREEEQAEEPKITTHGIYEMEKYGDPSSHISDYPNIPVPADDEFGYVNIDDHKRIVGENIRYTRNELIAEFLTDMKDPKIWQFFQYDFCAEYCEHYNRHIEVDGTDPLSWCMFDGILPSYCGIYEYFKKTEKWEGRAKK